MSDQNRPKNKPLLTVIIITKNDYENLIKTYKSCKFQSDINKYIELILVDGGSTDETQTFLSSHSSEFSKAISEPDNGIYDAMNKGVKLASGEWTIFMNAGDTFANPEVPGEIFEHFNDEIDVMYGDFILKYPGFDLIRKAGDQGSMWKGMITTHQSFVTRTSLLKENKFNVDYKLGADFDQIFKLYKQKKYFKYIPILIAIIDTSGISNRQIVRARCEHYKSIRANDIIGFGIHLYYAFNFICLIAINICRFLLPKNVYYRIIKVINRSSLT